jgi:nucleoid-associated protein YgaU
MIDRRSKIAIALGLLFGGAAVAMLFRHEAVSNLSGNYDRLVVRDPVESPDLVGPILGAPIPPTKPPVVLPVPPAETAKPSSNAYIPQSASSPPAGFSTSSSGQMPAGWPPPMAGLSQSAPPPEKAVRHRIRDGDTLTGLAERHLGSAARAGEIFDANREVLSNPDLLPIGMELKIPPREQSPQPQRPLVPITPRNPSAPKR